MYITRFGFSLEDGLQITLNIYFYGLKERLGSGHAAST
jgi:hypothetical protein